MTFSDIVTQILIIANQKFNLKTCLAIVIQKLWHMQNDVY